MGKYKKYLPQILGVIAFLSIFYFSTPISPDFDVWFHIKSGEIISKMGIIHHDVFAYTTTGRVWTPYEWLFQVIIYRINEFTGMMGVKIFTATIATLIVFGVYKILRNIFNLNLYLSLIFSFIFYASTQEFYTSRPQIMAYLFLIINLYLILTYFFKNKNYLWISLPITLAWANLHGSIFLDVAFFGGFAAISLLNFLVLKDKSYLKKFYLLLIYIPATILLTVLPPLGTIQYQLLYRFFLERDLITKFISEWAPLYVFPFSFYLLTGLILLVVGIFLYINYKHKNLNKSLWALIFIPLLLSPYTASRNSYYGYLSLIILTGAALAKINFQELTKNKKYIFAGIIAVVLLFHFWMVTDKRKGQVTDSIYYPTNAVNFIKNYNLQGHLFNEYGFGGYLLYELYPTQKVYIDGRTDLYLDNEMVDTLQLAYKKTESNDEYKKYLDYLWNKNDVSFVLLRTEKNVVSRKMASVLQNDPNWSLVFWDDVSILYVRKDGKNDNVIKMFGTKAATPYEKDPFLKDQQETALSEYQRMITVADSSKSRNTIGYIYLQEAKFDDAKAEFEKAIQVFPYNESPYMNLAELKLKDRDPDAAIKLYEKAQELAPDRGLIYIRLGTIIFQSYGDHEWTRKVWKQGLANTIDPDAKEQLQKLLNSEN